MAKTTRTPARAKDRPPPESSSGWWVLRLVGQMADLTKGFGPDIACLTLVAALALVAVIVGRDPFLVIGFATFFAVLVPLCRYFRLIR
jgi:hypothetical protein